MRSSRTASRAEDVEAGPQPQAGSLPASLVGPATVLEGGATHVRVRLQNGQETEAQLALAFLYQPQAGDVLLVICPEGACYGIGVLYAQGTPGISVAGDLSLHAVGGKLKLVGDEGVLIHTPNEATLSAGTLKTIATDVVDKVGTVTSWIKKQLNVRAGEETRVIEGTQTTRSKRSYHLAEDAIKVDAHQVHLGH